MEYKIYQDREKIQDTGSITEDYHVLFPETVANAIYYQSSEKPFKTVAQALDYILNGDFYKSLNEQTLDFTESESLIELSSGDTLSAILGKLAKSITELKALFNLVGSSDISNIGDGSIKGAISQLHKEFTANYGEISTALDTINRTVV